uniref:NADH-ubiquinone oxidoreductase chain 6 n=1 Tax=Daubentonia madagascariensis TaxID=31869 RepID=A0A0A7DFS9_DAUMA|nr:NADH dehydrogenase subunit 6 [Daubentonia madagascariensis]AII98672.1 NADH dehydrogenase subunit 6 [Daubentonia madagascariensis]
MMYTVFLLSVILVLGFVGFSSKPSPIYGGWGLVVSGGVGCMIILSFGGSFMGLMMFLIYLGGMLVVFGYTTAMATEEYPEVWGSSAVVWGALLLGFVMELFVVMWMMGYGKVGLVIDFKSLEDWMNFEGEMVDIFRGDCMGVAALYDYASWMLVIAGWSLFMGIFIVIEITRGC